MSKSKTKFDFGLWQAKIDGENTDDRDSIFFGSKPSLITTSHVSKTNGNFALTDDDIDLPSKLRSYGIEHIAPINAVITYTLAESGLVLETTNVNYAPSTTTDKNIGEPDKLEVTTHKLNSNVMRNTYIDSHTDRDARHSYIDTNLAFHQAQIVEAVNDIFEGITSGKK